MALEFAADGRRGSERYGFAMASEGACRVVDWAPMIEQVREDLRRRVSPADVSERFHNSLVEVIVAAARASGQQRIVLTGGCFQNVILSERAITRLRRDGFEPYWHGQVPPNDGGIAVGQVLAAERDAMEV